MSLNNWNAALEKKNVDTSAGLLCADPRETGREAARQRHKKRQSGRVRKTGISLKANFLQ